MLAEDPLCWTFLRHRKSYLNKNANGATLASHLYLELFCPYPCHHIFQILFIPVFQNTPPSSLMPFFIIIIIIIINSLRCWQSWQEIGSGGALPLVSAVEIYTKNWQTWSIAPFLNILEVLVSIVEISTVVNSQFIQYGFNISDRKSHCTTSKWFCCLWTHRLQICSQWSYFSNFFLRLAEYSHYMEKFTGKYSSSSFSTTAKSVLLAYISGGVTEKSHKVFIFLFSTTFSAPLW